MKTLDNSALFVFWVDDITRGKNYFRQILTYEALVTFEFQSVYIMAFSLTGFCAYSSQNSKCHTLYVLTD